MNRQDRQGRQGAGPEPDKEIDQLIAVVAEAAIEVHRALGAGFVEAIYERAMATELTLRGIAFARQVPVQLSYKGHRIGEGRIDLFVGDRLVVELKAVEQLVPAHAVQVRSYLRATCGHVGVLINFNVPVLLRGFHRIIQPRLLRPPGDPGGPGG